jgi:predicted aspartyl protease
MAVAIRYRYHAALQPPAPFVYVLLRRIDGTAQLERQPGQVDTGADRTVIPTRVVEALGLQPLDQIELAGFGGLRYFVKTYLLDLGINSLAPARVEVVAQENEPWVILGRDVLNGLRIVLDGPRQTFEVGEA